MSYSLNQDCSRCLSETPSFPDCIHVSITEAYVDIPRHLQGRCLTQYEYKSLLPLFPLLSSLKTQREACFILLAEVLLLRFTPP